jgi:hypothetical protein
MSFTIPSILYVNESKSTANLSNIGESKDEEMKYNSTAFNEFSQLNDYLNTEVTKFYNIFKENPNVVDSYNKTMQQRYLDLINMQNKLIYYLSKTSELFIGTDALDFYKKTQDLKNKRNTIDTAVGDLQSNNNANVASKDVKIQLDSTIYSTVLYSILAVVLIYYLFINL